MTGVHWVDEYSDYNKKKSLIENCFRFKIKTFKKDGIEGLKKFVNFENDNYEIVEEIENEMNSELEFLYEDYYSFTYYANNYEYETFNWIEDGMCEL